MKKFILFIAVFLYADDFKAGLEAYMKMQYQTAYTLFEHGCENGDNKCCNYVGILYENGLGVNQNYNKAISFYKKGCKTDSESCLNLGSLYLQLNKKQLANEAFKKACDNGYKAACGLVK